MKNEIANLLEMVDEGVTTPLDAYIKLEELSDLIDEAKEKVKKQAYDQIEAFGEKNYNFKGYIVNPKSKTTWSYKHIDKWNYIKAKLSNIEELAKVAATKNVEMYDPETGDQIAPAYAIYSYFPDIKAAK